MAESFRGIPSPLRIFDLLPTPDFLMASSHPSRLNQKFVKAPENLTRPAGRPVGRPRPVTEFLWVDYKENQSKARDLVRSKQAFVRTRHHRLRREKQVQNGCCPSSHTVSNLHSTRDDEEDDHPKQLTKFLISAPQACVLDGSPLTVSTKQNPNIYFQHYRIHSSRACFPLCSSDVTAWFWQRAIEDPTLMQIKLAISAAHRAAILTASGASPSAVQKPSQDALRFRGEAIKSLRHILQNTSTMSYEQTIFIITHIIISEALEANVEAAEMHMDAIKQMITVAGGMELLSFGTLAMLYSCEFLRGIMSNSLPKLDMCPKFQTRVLKESGFFKANNQFAKNSTLGTQFFDASWSPDINPILKSIISSLRQLVSYYESFNDVDVEPMSVENDCLLYLNYRLLSLPCQCSLAPFDETLRLTLLAYCCVRIWNLYGVPCLGNLIESLRKSLLQSFRVFQSTAPELLFYILFIGSLASRNMKPNPWFLVHLTDAADQLGLKDWDSAVSTLESFFFVSRPSDDPAKELWYSNF